MENQSKQSFKDTLSALLRSNRRHVRYVQALVVLAVLVAVVVPLAMRQYGVAMATTETRLNCQYAGSGAHTHNADCYDADGNLVCPLAEKPFHTHTADCYATETVLACGQEESEGHTHSEACYDEEGNLTCTLEEAPGHTHTDACYETRTTDQLICGLEETAEEHVHGPACFETVTVNVPDPEPTTPAATTEAAPAEDPNPEQEFTGSLKVKDEDGNERVVLIAQVKAPQGALPKGSTMRVEHVDLNKKDPQTDLSAQDKLNEALRREAGEGAAFVQEDAVDIAFYDAQGNRVDPAKKVEVRITTAMIRTFSDQRTAGDEAVANNSLLVLHVVDHQQTKRTDAPDAELIRKAALVNQDEKDTSTGHEDTILFEATEFSPYIVARVNNAALAPEPEPEPEPEAQPAESEQPAAEATLDLTAEDQPAEAEPERPAQSFTHRFTDTNGQMLMRVDVLAPEGAFPLGTTMQVKWVDVSHIEESVTQAVSERTDGKLRDMRAVDITFIDADGHEIEPAKKITVTFASDLIDTQDDAYVVHVDDEGKSEVIDALGSKELESREMPDQADELVFESDAFSTYVVAVTTLHKELAASDGATYDITVDAPAEAGIPQDAELRVSEVVEGDEGYEDYLAQAMELAGLETAADASYARFFDIQIWSGDQKIEPAGDVQVSIKLMDATAGSLTGITVVHFAEEGPEVLEITGAVSVDSTEVMFTTNEFSVYSVVNASTLDLNALGGREFALVSSDARAARPDTVDPTDDQERLPQALIAKMAESNNGLDSSSVQLEEKDGVKYVGGDASIWVFEKVAGKDSTYYLRDKASGQYIVGDNSRHLSLSSSNRTEFFVDLGYGDTIRLKATFSINGVDAGFINNERSGNWDHDKREFRLNQWGNYGASWFTLAIPAEDYTEQKATKISTTQISGSQDQELIIYMKEGDKLYALNHDGVFVEVTESGDSIYWRSSAENVDDLKWKVDILANGGYATGYYYVYWTDDETGETLYWAPSESANEGQGQTLSTTPFGVTLQGRSANRYSTTIEGWDDPKYAWVGIKKGDDGKAAPARDDESQEFMFASYSPVPNPGDSMQTVETVDSAALGLTIKMFDYTGTAFQSWDSNGQHPSYATPDGNENASRLYGMQSVFGNDSYLYTNDDYKKGATTGLLNSYISSDQDLPTAASGTSLARLFDDRGATASGSYTDNGHSANSWSFTSTYMGEGNHLFTQSYYDETGYLRYSSAENYAYYTDNDFRVYQQIASPYINPRNDQWYFNHGHFMPYNDISNQRTYITNMYGQTGEVSHTDNPRAFEEVYGINGSPNFFTGMSMEGDFAQLTDGKDARGNDIIYKFTGDDDLWVFVDGVLVLDLGGIHEAVSGEINFATGVVTTTSQNDSGGQTTTTTTIEEMFNKARADAANRGDAKVVEKIDSILSNMKVAASGNKIFGDNTTHEFKMYYLERGAGASNLDMTFNLPLTKKGSFNVDKTIGGEGTQTAYQDEIFAYRAYIKEVDGTYSILNSNRLKSATYEGTNDPITFDANGVFRLKHGESVTLQLKDVDLDKEYYVEELGVDSNLWEKVTINGDPAPLNPSSGYAGAWPSTVTQEGMSYVGCDPETAANRSRVSFVNEPKTHKLFITKRVVDANGNEIDPGLDTTFEFKVFFEGTNAEESAEGKVRPYKQGPYYLFKEVDGHIHYFDIREGGQIVDEGENKVIAGVSGEHGSIAKIPAGYTVEIDGLLAGTQFWVEERETHPEMPYGYELLEKRAIKEGGEATYQVTTHEHAIDDSHPDYTVLDPRTSETYPDPDLRDAEGRILPNKDAQFEIVNRYQQAKINVEKQWVNGVTTDAKVKVTIGRYRLLKDGETIPTETSGNNDSSNGSETYSQTYEPTITEPVPSGYAQWVKDGYAYVVDLEDGHWSEKNIPVDKIDKNGNPYIYYVRSIEETGLEEGTTVTYPENLFISTGETGTFTVINTIPKPIPIDIEIKKADAETMDSGSVTYLDGAVFRLQKEDGSTWITPAEVTVNGVPIVTNGQFTVPTAGITLGNLTTGTYQLIEISAPAGYSFTSNTPVTFVVDNTGVITSTEGTIDGVEYTAKGEDGAPTDAAQFVIPNPPGAELPEAGGPGTYLYTLCGLALFAAAGYIGFVSRRSSRKEVV